MAASTLVVVLVIQYFHRTAVAQRGQSQVSLVGENVTLSCSLTPSQYFPSGLADVNCKEDYFRYWSKVDDDGTWTQLTTCTSILESNLDTSRYTVDISSDNAYDLHISQALESDKGQYTCSTFSNQRSPSSVNELLIQLNMKQASCAVSPQDVQVGDDVSLTCSLDIPRSLQWMASNGTLVGSSQITNRQNSLIFDFTAKEDDSFDTFTCVSITTSGAYIPTCSVTPLEHQFVTISPLRASVKVGDNVTFTCKSRLGPENPQMYNYTWIIYGREMLPQRPGLDGSSYTVSNVQYDDNGKVRCRAQHNEVEMNSAEAVIYVTSDNASASSGNTSNTGLILGCLFGIGILIVLCVILVVFLMRKRKQRSATSAKHTGAVFGNFGSGANDGIVNSLSLQKDNASHVVTSTDGSTKTSSSATAPQTGGHETPPTSGACDAYNDGESTYALPLLRDDVNHGTLDDRNDTRQSDGLINEDTAHPNVEGLLYAELDVNNANADNNQIINSAEPTVYAAIQQMQ